MDHEKIYLAMAIAAALAVIFWPRGETEIPQKWRSCAEATGNGS